MIDIRQVESIYKLDFSLERLATTDEKEQEGVVRGERYALSWRRKVFMGEPEIRAVELCYNLKYNE